MGWLFSERWPNKAELVKHLVEGNGMKTLKHCCVGNDLWCVHEANHRGEVVRFICLYMMKGPMKDKGYTGDDKDWWGYKDVDESAGPCKVTCPPSYLDMCTYPVNQYAYDWRQEVYARERKLRGMIPGKRIKYGDVIYEVIKRMRAGTCMVTSPSGTVFRIKPRQLARAEVLS